MSFEEARVEAEIREAGPAEAFRTLIAENDALIAQPDIDNGRQITIARSAIYTGIVRAWAVEQV